MFRYMILTVLLTIAEGAPASEPETTSNEATNHLSTANPALEIKENGHPIPILAAAVAAAPAVLASATANTDASSRSTPIAKQLFFADLPLVKTPASATKLMPLTASFVGPITPLTYASPPILAPYPAWNGLAALPTTYSIEQHGYHIAY